VEGLALRLFFDSLNVCDHNNPPTLQTDRQTDGLTDDILHSNNALRTSECRAVNTLWHRRSVSQSWHYITLRENFL